MISHVEITKCPQASDIEKNLFHPQIFLFKDQELMRREAQNFASQKAISRIEWEIAEHMEFRKLLNAGVYYANCHFVNMTFKFLLIFIWFPFLPCQTRRRRSAF